MADPKPGDKLQVVMIVSHFAYVLGGRDLERGMVSDSSLGFGHDVVNSVKWYSNLDTCGAISP